MDTEVADSFIGALVAGRYRIRGRVARGGMATVYTATDERLERVVALKIIHPAQAATLAEPAPGGARQAGDPRFVDRFADEAHTIARLTHPNVVAVYDQGVHEGRPYLIMEYVRGRTLRELISERHRLPPTEALAILEQVLSAVSAAHRAGMIHRDIKPENVLVAAPPSGSLLDAVVKVADFGLARAVEASTDAGTGQLLATVAYVAPELVTTGRADPRTDIYAAGIMLFEMITGRVPYQGDKAVEVAWQHVDQDVPPPSRYVPGLPPALDELVARATRRDPAARPSDAAVMLPEVQAVREEVGVAAAVAAQAGAGPTMPVPVSGPGPGNSATQVMTVPGGGGGGWPPAGGPGETTAILSDPRPSWARLPAPPQRPPTRSGTVHRSGELRGRRESTLRRWYAQATGTPRGRQAMIAAAAVLALLVVLGGWWFGAGRYTSTPSLTQLPQDQAIALARQHGLKVRIGAGQYDEKIAKGIVLGQHPGGNQRIVRGGTVTLVLSKGPERYKVPDEHGRAYDEASQALTADKMVVKRVDAYDDAMPVGNVLTTDPPAGTVVAPGTEITVTVSKGKAPISVPNVIGEQQADAEQQLEALGLKVAFTQQQSDKPAGQVIDQSIADGSGAEKGETIILTVSSGPPMVAVPDVSNQGLSFDQANQILQQAGLVGVQVLALPGGQVRQQNPAAQTQVPPGTQVQLWILP